MKTIKKIIEVILAIVIFSSFILMCGERPDGSACLPLTLGCMAVLVVAVKILDKMGVFNENSQSI